MLGDSTGTVLRNCDVSTHNPPNVVVGFLFKIPNP